MLRKLKLKPFYSSFLPKVLYSSNPKTSHGQDEHTIYSILNPFIDFDERIQNTKLENSISKRNLQINLDHLSKLWTEYKNIQDERIKLENSKNEIQEKIKSFKDPKKHEKDIEGLKLAGKVLRQDIKNNSSTLSSIEQILLPKVIKLPNDVREELFSKEIELYFKPSPKKLHHLDVAKKLDLVDYFSKTTYFLKNEAAQFELDASSAIFDLFCSNNYIPFSTPDFSRTLIIEGTCVNPKSVIKLSKDNRNDDLYLNGSASFYPFCSFHAKTVSESIPIKYVTQGRKYEQSNFEDGLYSVWQSNAVQIFIASSESGILEEFDKTMGLITNIYKAIGLHFRIVSIPPSELELSEANRISFQVHSPYTDTFYEVGNISFFSDYISKRLRMYHKDGTDKSFLHVVSGTVMKVPPLLACFLECTEGCKLPKISMF